MLGSSGKERVATTIGNLQWQLGAAEAELEDEYGDDNHRTPVQTIKSMMSSKDEDGSGTISRDDFRNSLNVCFEKLNIAPLEEVS